MKNKFFVSILINQTERRVKGVLWDLQRRVQNLLEESFLKEGPKVRLYHRSDWGADFGSSFVLFAIGTPHRLMITWRDVIGWELS